MPSCVAPQRLTRVIVFVVGGCWSLLVVAGGCWQLLAAAGRMPAVARSWHVNAGPATETATIGSLFFVWLAVSLHVQAYVLRT